MGIISCLGLDRTTVGAALREGRSGIVSLPERTALGFQSSLSGAVHGFAAADYLDRKKRKTLPEFGLWAWAAVEQALKQAAIAPESLRGDSGCGLIFGNDSSAVTAVEQTAILKETKATKSIGSGHIFRLLNSTISLNISTILGIRGACWTISSACASGAMAIGQAAELIAAGRQERMICGGAQEISWQSMCSFDTLGAFSRREKEPGKASRPFDRDRDGLVPSGGAAAVILESYDRALERGATILGEILGYGYGTDGSHVVVPSGDGMTAALTNALQQAGIAPKAVDLVLAHATSTPVGDTVEARVLKNIFQIDTPEKSPVITAVKGLTGHEFWMAGASQVVYGLIMGRSGFVAGNVNLERPDPEAELLRLPRQSISMAVDTMLLNAAGFGGTNSCLILRVGQ